MNDKTPDNGKESPVIKLPKDQAVVANLHRRLADCIDELSQMELSEDDVNWKSPEQLEEVSASTLYRKRLLETLLRDERVETLSLAHQIRNERGLLLRDDFCGACDEIQALVTSTE